MNTKILLILPSLLFITNFLHSNDTPKQYKNQLSWARIEAEKARATQTGALKILNNTKKGHLYKVNLQAWHTCMNFPSNNYDAKETMCEQFHQATKNALKTLKETPEYYALQSIVKEVTYHENLEKGLVKILYADFDYSLNKGYSKEYREKMLNDVIGSNTIGDLGKASEMFLTWAEDIRDDEKRAQEELRSIVTRIEANNRSIQN